MIAAAVDYPDTLPCFIRNQAIQETNRITRKVFQAGLSRQRVRFADAPSFYTVSLWLTDAELSIWEEWRHNTLKEANWFNAYVRGETGPRELWVLKFLRTGQPIALGRSRWKFTFDLMGFKTLPHVAPIPQPTIQYLMDKLITY